MCVCVCLNTRTASQEYDSAWGSWKQHGCFTATKQLKTVWAQLVPSLVLMPENSPDPGRKSSSGAGDELLSGNAFFFCLHHYSCSQLTLLRGLNKAYRAWLPASHILVDCWITNGLPAWLGCLLNPGLIINRVSALVGGFFFVNPPNGKSLLKVHQEQENICLTFRRYQLNSASDKEVSSLSEVKKWKCAFGVGE